MVLPAKETIQQRFVFINTLFYACLDADRHKYLVFGDWPAAQQGTHCLPRVLYVGWGGRPVSIFAYTKH